MRVALVLAAVVGICAGCSRPPAEPDMVIFEPGSFVMGTADGAVNAAPVHDVRLTRGFMMARTEVTREEYARFCRATGRTMPRSRGEENPRLPVVGVDWTDAAAYCNWLSGETGREACYSGRGAAIRCDFDADGYRLPTEAEWEYAAKGTDPDTTGVFGGLSGPGPLPVASRPPNAAGIYDMAGNSFEWCWDWYADDYYTETPGTDPAGPASPPEPSVPRGPVKSRRSGSWRESRAAVLPTSRSQDHLYYAGDNGVRLVRTVR